jgi:hypothetical protein
LLTRYRGLIATLVLVVLGLLACGWLLRSVSRPTADRVAVPGGRAPATAGRVAATSSAPIAAATSSAASAMDHAAAGPSPASPPMAHTLDRASAALAAAARPCAASVASDANPKQQIRHYVRVDHGRATQVTRADGDMAPGLVDCIEGRWRTARWDDAEQPRTLTMELVTTLEQLRRGR